MEKAKKRIYICLITAILAAILAGGFYYFDLHAKEQDMKNGVLITTVKYGEIGNGNQ